MSSLEDPVAELYPLKKEMLIQATEREPRLSKMFDDWYKTQLCERAAERERWALKFVLD